MLITQAEWARRHGFSRQYARRLVQKGVVRMINGKVDPAQADAALLAIREPARPVRRAKPTQPEPSHRSTTAPLKSGSSGPEPLSLPQGGDLPTLLLKTRIKSEVERARLLEIKARVEAGTGANTEIGPAIARLRDRSRDLVRNNPYAAKAVQAVVSNLVGTGIMPRTRAGDTVVNDQADKLWARFAQSCDADGLTDFYGLQALVVRAIAESGECLIRIRERRFEDGLPVPLQLQLLEPDHLDTGKTGELAGGGFVVQGVEFDALGRRRAYWLYPVHPGEVATFRKVSLVSKRVSADGVLHLFERLRPGQVRGVPWFAPVILKLRDLDEYDDAELVRKKIEACFAAFVTGSEDEETLGTATTDAAGRRVEAFEPGMIEYLAPGKDVKFAAPSAGGGYAEYMRVQLHAIAAGVGLTYELLTGDLSQVNYSSIRAGLIEFRRRMEALQWQLLVPALCQPVWHRFVGTAQAIGALPEGAIEAEWTAPRFEAVDPLKDVQADILAVRAGLMTLKEAIARQGYDPAQVLAEIGETNDQLDTLGIVLDTDPRKATKTGQAKPLMEDKDE